VSGKWKVGNEGGEVGKFLLVKEISMKVFLLYIFGLLCIINVDAQTATKSYGKIAVTITKEKKRKGPIYCKVEIEQAFTGGDSSWIAQTEKSINEALLAYREIKKGVYIVVAQFVLDKVGNLSDVRALSNVGYGMEEAVMRALKKGKGPRWEPAKPGEGILIKPYRKSIVTVPLSDDEN
jgi:periplasmic protein TonB